MALYFQFVHGWVFPGYQPGASSRFLIGVAVTTVAWVGVTLLTRPTDEATLRRFCRLARPGGPGWSHVLESDVRDGARDDGRVAPWDVPRGVVCAISGSAAVYAVLFATGHALYGRPGAATVFALVAVVSILIVSRVWRRLGEAGAGVDP
jgi:hypothetical protein